MKKLFLAGAAMAALLPMSAMARGRVGVFVGPSFGYGYWGGFGPYYGYWGAPYGASISRPPNMGVVRLDTKLKDADVFINGTYAGSVGQLKSMNLRPGAYEIEVRAIGHEPYDQRVFVVAGKTLKLRPDLPLAPSQPEASGS